MRLPLLPPVDDDRPVAFGAEGSKSYGDLRRLALACERALDDTERVLLLCEDRFFFAAALLGAVSAGCRVLLPPHRGNVARETLANGAVVLRDTDAEPGLDVRNLAPHEGVFDRSLLPEAPFVELFTSGSTGEPERWTKSARQLLGEAMILREILGLDEHSRIAASVSPQHIYGLLFGVLAPLAAGASFSRATPRLGPTIEAVVRDTEATHLVSVPAQLGGCEDWAEAVRPIVVTSGATLRDDLLALLAKKGFRLVDVLGSSETGGFGHRSLPGDARFRPFPGTRIEVEDERVLLRSPFLADPTTRHVLADALELSKDGTFRHLGRADDVVKVGGKRVALGEVEAVARRVPGVVDAWCFAEPTNDARASRLTLLAIAPGYDEELLLATLRNLLDPSLVPRRVRFVSELPTLPSGKRDGTSAKRLMGSADEAEALEWSAPEIDGPVARRTTRLPRNFRPFRGHFPEDPILPAIAILDELVLPWARELFRPLTSLARIERWKLSAPLRPGDEVTVTLERKEGGRVDFSIASGGTITSAGRAFFVEGTNGDGARTVVEASPCPS